MLNHFRTGLFAVGICISLMAGACGGKKGNPAGPTDPGGAGGGSSGGGGATGGTVTGRVTTGNGLSGVGSVTVSLANGSSPSTTSNSTGAFTLTGVPAGTQSLRARRGNFEVVFSATVTTGQSVAAPPVALKAIGRLAYVSGSFDQMEKFNRTNLGNTIDEIQASQLGSTAVLNQFKMIFLNCGLDERPADDPAVVQALLAWVRAGGVLYASDWALKYLRTMLPSDVPEIEDLTDSETVTAAISDSAVQTFVGKSTAQLFYDIGGWKGLKSISSRSRVLLRGSYKVLLDKVPDRALAIVISEGSGKVIYSTFHDEDGAPPDQLDLLRYYVYIE